MLMRLMLLKLIARLAVLVTVIAVCTMPTSSQELANLVVAGSPGDDFKPVYYGVQSGLFRRYGLNVTIESNQSGAASVASVVGGTSQFAETSTPTVIQGFARGVPFRIIVAGELYTDDRAGDALFVSAASPIRSARDLDGKIVGVQALNAMFSLATKAWLDQHGGDSASIKLIELPVSAAVPALEQGRIDAGRLTSPFMEQALAEGKVRLLAKNLGAIAPRFQETAYVATAQYITDNPDVVRRFVRAMHESIVYTNTHLKETVPLVASFTGVTEADVARSTRAIDAESADPRYLQPVIDFLYRYKQIDRSFNASDIISPLALKPGER